MKLRDLTNPRHVYEGAFEMYFIRPFVHHYADFKGEETARSALWALVAWLVVTMGLAGVLMGLVGLLGPEAGFRCLAIVGIVWGALSLCPLCALVCRAMQGSADTAGQSAARRPHDARMLGVDTLLGVSCLLFFAFGLLMMTTTLNSGMLRPNANATDEVDTVEIEGDKVVEEPIFTYQDEAPAEAEPADTLQDLAEPDALAPDESFDPTLGTDASDLLPPSDSI